MAKLLKEVTGMTIFVYVKKRRMNQAKILFMMDKNLAVSDVCYEVGYKHLSHLSRLFKQEFGCTPEQFHRNEHPAFYRKPNSWPVMPPYIRPD